MPKTSAATQDFVAIKDIKDGIVLLKNGQMCTVLLASSINFALKSTDEQQAILQQFQTFINTIDFSLQIYVQSRRLNVEPYLQLLAGREANQDNDLMRIQLREYVDFIRTFTTEVDIMAKNFYVIVPYYPAPINIGRGLTSLFGSSSQTGATTLPADKQFEEQRIQLEQRISVVQQGLSGIGVRTVQLKNDDLVELFYHIYNPADPTGAAPARNI
jgi:type IV secretory pathway VirB4 component